VKEKKWKKIKAKKHKNTLLLKSRQTRERSNSLSLSSFFTPNPSSQEFFFCLFAAIDKSIFVIIHTTTPKNASSRKEEEEAELRRTKEKTRERKREKEERFHPLLSLFFLSSCPFCKSKSNPTSFCALDGSLTAANPGVPFK